jgi:beta-glucosidase
VEAFGRFELIVNGDTLFKPVRFRPIPPRIPLTVEKGKEYKIEARFRQIGNWPASLSLNFGKEVPVEFGELIEKLKGIDVVIFAGGISSQLEGEQMPIELPGFKGGDRTDIELPEIQRNCLKALEQAGKRAIFVNCSGSAMGLVPETETCDAILQAWYGGESGGQAVADVLFGDFNPSGKLPITFYKNIQQLGDFEDYSMKGRTYRFMSDPLFPFGFGLSYTTFSVGEAKFSKTSIKADETIELSVPISNTGKRDGTEIVQVFVRKANDTDGPLKTLRGFQRVDVAAGKNRKAVIHLPYSAFEFYDRAGGKMDVTAGEYEVLYGNSSDVKNLKMRKITVQ